MSTDLGGVLGRGGAMTCSKGGGEPAAETSIKFPAEESILATGRAKIAPMGP